MPRLLVVHHSPTRSLQALRDAVLEGAGHEDIPDVEVVARPALEATADDVLAADGYLLGTSANFGYMSGALKHFFDSTFLAVGGALDDSGGASEQPAGETAKRPWDSGCTGATTPPAPSVRCSPSWAPSAGGRRTPGSTCSAT